MIRALLSLVPLIALAAFPALGAVATPQPKLHVQVDPRVELISLVFRLAGNPEYSQGRVASYNAAADKHFAPFKNHSAIQLARRLRQTRGISYDACMSMAVHLRDANELELAVPLDPWPEGLDSRWTPETATNFLTELRWFAQDSGFHSFRQEHAALYQTTTGRITQLVEDEMHLEWFDQFFGEKAKARFTLIPGMLNGGSCYGVRSRDFSGTPELFCILGVWQTDSEGLPTFTRPMLGTVVHEFSHSYANPVLEPYRAELRLPGERLYRHVGSQMRSQAYGNAHTMLCESLVRAGEVRYHARFDGPAAATRAIQQEKSRGFLWIEELSSLLEKYENSRQEYPTLASFTPKLVGFFRDYAADFEVRQKKTEANRPKVLSMTPANNATNVSAALQKIEVVFDRPMKDQTWSMVGGGPHFPELVGKPSYDSSRKTWSVGVKLKPDWTYRFGLNSGSFAGFQSEDGVALVPIEVNFSTGPQ